MAENEKTDIKEIQTEEPQKPDGILTKKINGKTFVTEIYFDKKSKETFQDKLFKVIQAKGNSGD
ncbi:transposon-encoded TnpW family protein [Granulicatella elegans]|uniref:transposon-encoded TnpW family protein n=1 Tax=Granulicatella elegans TaxID=137732 RepID=UPI001D15D805|nr:transposon-encoded TnpW family protein [Granulicatella elegans]UEA32123.1 transposon-encoded TnpW family protein [Granulicatella elegans]